MQNSQWQKMGIRAADLQQAVMYAYGAGEAMRKTFSISPISTQAYLYERGSVSMFWNKAHTEVNKADFLKLLGDINFVSNYAQLILNASETSIKKIENIASQIQSDPETLIKLHLASEEVWQYFFPYAWSLWLMPTLEDLVRAYIPDGTEEALGLLAYPTTPTPISEAEEALLALAEDIEEQGAAQLAEKYGWMAAYNFSDAPYNAEYYLAEAKKITQSGISIADALQEKISRRKEAEKYFDELLVRISDPLQKAQISLFHQAAYLRDKREEARDKMTLLLQNMFRQEALLLGMSLEEVTFLTTDEIIHGLRKERSISELQVLSEERRMGFLVSFHNETVVVSSDRETIKQFKDQVAISHSGNLKGQAAFVSEVVKGRVKIVLSNKDVAKVEEGDILVASMTKPDFIPAMKLASAFVTDEGGITCHAAIIAREMRKPCILSTKVATQVLKDGDYVEVDTKNALVRVI